MRCAGCHGHLEPVAYCEDCRDAKSTPRFEYVVSIGLHQQLAGTDFWRYIWDCAIAHERGSLECNDVA
jgi:hypothetical protein